MLDAQRAMFRLQGAIHVETEVLFRHSAAKALLDPQLRANFRRAMDGLVSKRRAQFPDPDDLQDLRHLSTAIRSRSLLCLPELLEQLEATCTKNGIQVHWAETCEQGNELILGIPVLRAPLFYGWRIGFDCRYSL